MLIVERKFKQAIIQIFIFAIALSFFPINVEILIQLNRNFAKLPFYACLLNGIKVAQISSIRNLHSLSL